MTRYELLTAARAKIDTPQKWCKAALAKNLLGKSCRHSSESAVQYCAVGAIESLTSRGRFDPVALDAIIALRDALGGGGLQAYNDRPETKHADIMALYDKAISIAKEEGK